MKLPILLLSLLLILPIAYGIDIAASPNILIPDATGKTTLRLFNPNQETIEYVLSGAYEAQGILLAQEHNALTLENPRGRILEIAYRPASGAEHIMITPILHIPVLVPSTYKKTHHLLFLLAFLAVLLLGITYKIL